MTCYLKISKVGRILNFQVILYLKIQSLRNWRQSTILYFKFYVDKLMLCTFLTCTILYTYTVNVILSTPIC